MLICPRTLSFETEIFSPRSQLPRLPGEVATHGACLLSVHLAGKAAGPGSRSWVALEPAHLHACRGRRAAPLPRLGTWQALRSWGLPGSWQAVGVGQPCIPWAAGPGSRDTWWPPTLGLPWSWAAPEPGSWEAARLAWWQAVPHSANQACWDFSPQNLSSGKWFCPRISYLLCDFPKTQYLEEKFMKWL